MKKKLLGLLVIGCIVCTSAVRGANMSNETQQYEQLESVPSQECLMPNDSENNSMLYTCRKPYQLSPEEQEQLMQQSMLEQEQENQNLENGIEDYSENNISEEDMQNYLLQNNELSEEVAYPQDSQDMIVMQEMPEHMYQEENQTDSPISHQTPENTPMVMEQLELPSTQPSLVNEGVVLAARNGRSVRAGLAKSMLHSGKYYGGSAAHAVGNKIAEVSQNVGEKFLETTAPVNNTIANIAVTGYEHTKDFGQNAGHRIANGAVTGYKKIADFSKRVGRRVKKLANAGFEKTKNIFTQENMNTVRQQSADTAHTVLDGIKTTANSAGDIAVTVGNTIADGSKNFGNSVAKTGDSSLKRVKRFF